MKKVLSCIALLILVFVFAGCDNNTATRDEIITSDTISTSSKHSIDYNDAKSFESALNDGAKVNGKVVRFDVIEYKPDSAMGINCWSGEHLNFISENELDVDKGDIVIGRITKEPSNIWGSWKIPYEVLEIEGKTAEANNNINSTSDSKNTNNDGETNKITVTVSEDDFKGMHYREAENKFSEMGFTKFEYKTVKTDDKTSTDTICYIEIVEFILGDSDFTKGDQFDSKSTVIFYYYKYTEPEKPTPLFYSTNDYETAKKGNSGVFSYKSNGDSYDIYWIIDFNTGYVYYFTDGNDESFCDKLKINSGTLNDAISITYHDSGSSWSHKLHFKYENHPETLIMVDQNGFEFEYTTTSLDDAINIRNTKTIKEY